MSWTVYLIHWPVPLNPKGNHPVFPLLPDGKRDVDHAWKLADTWKQMEDVLKKGQPRVLRNFLLIFGILVF
jgi:glycerol 2-dehydrogenase (NADP+)